MGKKKQMAELGPSNAAEMSKMSDDGFVERLARGLAEAGFERDGHPVTLRDAHDAWHAMAEAIVGETTSKGKVSLPAFGTFYMQHHKGHTVQFGGAPMKPYAVFRFKCAMTLSKKVRAMADAGEVTFARSNVDSGE